jgi:hypothetical protein
MRWPMEHWGILVACLLKVFFNILIFWWISRRIMGRTLLPQSARLWLDRVWAIVSLQRFRSWIWYIFTETARACWLILCGSDQDQVEKTITRYQTILKSVGRAWHWLTPRLAAVEFVGATVLLGMVVGNNLRVVAEIKGWV